MKLLIERLEIDWQIEGNEWTFLNASDCDWFSNEIVVWESK